MRATALLLLLACTSCEHAVLPPSPHSVEHVVSVPPTPPSAPARSDATLQASFRSTQQDQIALIRNPSTRAAVVRQLSVMDAEVKRSLAPWHRKQAKPTAEQVEQAIINLSALKAYLADQKTRGP